MTHVGSALDIIAHEFASVFETGNLGLENRKEWPEDRMERLAKSFEKVGRPSAAKVVRQEWTKRKSAVTEA